MTVQEEDSRMAFNFRLVNYSYLAALTLLYYDYVLTFGFEVELVWKRSFKLSSYLFCLNRYLLTLGNIAVAYSLFTSSLSPSSCMQLSLYHEILLGVAQIVVCINLSLRIYAIYLRSRVILFTLSFIFVVLAAAALFSNFYKRQTILSQIEGCHMMDAGMLEAAKTATFWEVLFIYDVIILFLLLRKGFETRKEMLRYSVKPPSLLVILIRDGTMYFVIVALTNLINIFFLYLTDLRSALTGLASSISITMMSRLILNLHETADEGLSTISWGTSFDIATVRSQSNQDD